ncbi:tRNA (guanosine(37)-N1)-methyltransferase TrmD [Patescibacteria group bacterium]|nr:tRNA (guanosine(37)-N1)-methyltransferase TrmD [Patescibacteria group bacterium]MBU1967326.1 tRNA (guanosine(37)-N1)-methyltransferase TrmD [Patescibacteria group bacterium]
MMQIDIVTLFPEMFASIFTQSIIKRAQDSGAVEIKIYNLRDFAIDKHKIVDDRPYGGGPGMVLKVDVLHQALEKLKEQNPQAAIILLTPQGEKYTQQHAEQLATKEDLILVAGHYEGFDDRIRKYVDQEISIGDYVLTGGEIPAMTIVDSVVRLIPGVLGDDNSASTDSFSSGMLGYPQYTRPEKFKEEKVPAILLSGNHAKINKWRQEQAKKRTKQRRPDLLS